MTVLYTGGSYKCGVVSETNLPVTTYYEYLDFTNYEHFNILTQTFTNMTVTLEGTLNDSTWNDVTSDLFVVTTLSPNQEYLADTPMTYKNLRVTYTPTSGTNTINFEWMVKKGGGR